MYNFIKYLNETVLMRGLHNIHKLHELEASMNKLHISISLTEFYVINFCFWNMSDETDMWI